MVKPYLTMTPAGSLWDGSISAKRSVVRFYCNLFEAKEAKLVEKVTHQETAAGASDMKFEKTCSPF